MFDKTSHVMTAKHKARCLLEERNDSWERHKVEAKHAYYVNFLFQHQCTSWLQRCTSSEGRQSLWKSSPSCKLTKACSSKPTANLLIITYLQRPWGRRSCKNTFDIVYTKMFFFSACCNEVSPRLLQWIPLQCVGSRHTGWNNTCTPVL